MTVRTYRVRPLRPNGRPTAWLQVRSESYESAAFVWAELHGGLSLVRLNDGALTVEVLPSKSGDPVLVDLNMEAGSTTLYTELCTEVD